MSYTIEGDEEARIRIRDLEGLEGTGIVLNPRETSSQTYGGPLSAVGPMEAENLTDSDAWVIARFD